MSGSKAKYPPPPPHQYRSAQRTLAAQRAVCLMGSLNQTGRLAFCTIKNLKYNLKLNTIILLDLI